jgi:KaiC/GvpD/RAD55 family RecA-like ATPase
MARLWIALLVTVFLLVAACPLSFQTPSRDSPVLSSQDDCSSQFGQVGNWQTIQDGSRDLITVDTFANTHSDLGQPYVDLSSLAYANSQACLYFQFNLRGNIPFATASIPVRRIWYQVLVDIDQSRGTGYHWSDSFTPEYTLDLEIGFAPGDEPTFSVMRYSGTGSDWTWTDVPGTKEAGTNAFLRGGIGQDFLVLASRYQDIAAGGPTITFFARTGIRMNDGSAYNDYVPDSGTLNMTLPVIATSSHSSLSSTPTTTRELSSVLSTTAAISTQNTGLQMPFGNLGSIGIIAIIAVIVFVLVVVRKRKAPQAVTTLKSEPAPRGQLLKKGAAPTQPIVATGYADLDWALEGGIPEGFAVVIVSPSCDERDLLLRRIVEFALTSGRPAFLVSNDMNRVQDLSARYRDGFYAFSAQADKISSRSPNLYKIPNIENLSDASISLTLAIKDAHGKAKAAKVIIIIDILSDVLLRHKSITTRKWLLDLVNKRKAEGFTTLATLNPLTASKEETQTVIELFDGVIEIYEKALAERSRRFLVIKKMYGRKYSENELLLDKDKLF